MKYRGNRNINIEEILNKFMDQELYKNKKMDTKHNIKAHSKVNNKNHNKKNNNNSFNDAITQFNLDSSNSIKNKNIDDELINITNNVSPVKKDKNLSNPNIKLNLFKKNHKKKNDSNTTINNCNFININKKRRLSKTTTKQKDFSQLNILSIIYSFFCSCSSKKQKLRNHFFQQAAEKINYYMDIRTYISQALEHDLIVNLLFNNDEIHLFKFLSKPTIKVGENDILIFQNPNHSEYIFHNYTKQKIDQLLQSYNTIYKKDKKPRLSKQLLEYMSEQIEFLS